MNLSLAATALSFDLPRLRRKHPNRLPFRGVLTVLDVPSDRAPSGSNNRRVLIPRAVAEAALPSLIGMALDYTPTLDGHDSRRKIGIITAADIVNAPPVFSTVLGAGSRRSSITRSVETGLAPSPMGLPATVGAPASVDPWLLARVAQRPVNTPALNAQGFSPGAATHGSRLEVRGYIFARDFPELVLELLRTTSLQPRNFNPQLSGVSNSSSLQQQTSGVAATAYSPPVHWRDRIANGGSPLGTTATSLAATSRAISAESSMVGRIRAHVPIQPFSYSAAFGQRQTTNVQRPLGMSYEIAEAQIVNEASPIWVLKDFVFTGAAVLRRDRAAYQQTSIELLND